MEISYTTEKRDFLNFHLLNASKSERVKKARRSGLLIVPLIFLIGGIYSFITNGDPAGVVILFAMAIFWLIFYPSYSRNRYKRHYLKFIEENYGNRFGKPVSLAIEDEYFVSKDHASDSRFKQSEIVELYEVQNYLYIKLSTGVTLILPKRAKGFEGFKVALTKIAEKQYVEHIVDMDWKWK